MIAARWNRGTADEFWADFTDSSGKRMEYTAIKNALIEERKRDDETTAAKARTEYGSLFEEKFSYRKSGQQHVLTKAADIAKRYRVLKNGDNIDHDTE